jgi:hypothetical protein
LKHNGTNTKTVDYHQLLQSNMVEAQTASGAQGTSATGIAHDPLHTHTGAAALTVGDLIHLPQELIDQTKLSVSETEEFYGTIGVEEGRLAVHLNERILKE